MNVVDAESIIKIANICDCIIQTEKEIPHCCNLITSVSFGQFSGMEIFFTCKFQLNRSQNGGSALYPSKSFKSKTRPPYFHMKLKISKKNNKTIHTETEIETHTILPQ